jgi:hypothetical protein
MHELRFEELPPYEPQRMPEEIQPCYARSWSASIPETPLHAVTRESFCQESGGDSTIHTTEFLVCEDPHNPDLTSVIRDHTYYTYRPQPLITPRSRCGALVVSTHWGEAQQRMIDEAIELSIREAL